MMKLTHAIVAIALLPRAITSDAPAWRKTITRSFFSRALFFAFGVFGFLGTT